MKIQRLGHTFFRIATNKGKIILIDPWIIDNPSVPIEWRDKSKYEDVDIVLLSHAHNDHFPGLRDIVAVNPTVKIVCIYEIAVFLTSPLSKKFWTEGQWSQKIPTNLNIYPTNVGGNVPLDGLTFIAVSATHSSSFFDGEQLHSLGCAMGYILSFEDGTRLYYAGDTGLNENMNVIGKFYNPDIAIVPIDGAFNMSPKAATQAIKWIKPKIVIPCHYFPPINLAPVPDEMVALFKAMPNFATTVDCPEAFKRHTSDLQHTKVIVLKLNESFTV